MKRIGIYCRVSSSDQVIKGSSLETQQTNGIQFCMNNGFEYLIYRDEGKSGFETSRRLGYNKMLEDMRNGLLDGVWYINVDRLNRNLFNSQEFISIVLSYEIDVYENGILVDLGDINEKFGYNIRSLIAEFNRETNRKRSIASKKRKLREGYFISGSTPFGYNRIDKGLEINEEESGIIKDIFNWLERGLSRNAVSVELKLKFPENYIRKGYRKNVKFSAVWVGRLLKLDYYVKGVFEYKFMDERGSVNCDVIIPEERYKRVISNIRSDKKSVERDRKSYLEGKCFCWKCNKKMIMNVQKGWKRKDGSYDLYYYFKCQDRDCLKTEWKGKFYQIDEYEDKVEKYIKRFIIDTDFFNDELRRVMEDEIKKRTILVDKTLNNRKSIERKIKDCEDKLDRLKYLFIEGDIEEDMYAERKNLELNKIREYRKQLDDNVEPDIKHIEGISTDFKSFDGSIEDFLEEYVDRIIVRVIKRDYFKDGKFIKLKFIFKGLMIDNKNVEKEIREKRKEKNKSVYGINTSLTSNLINPQRVFSLHITSSNKNNDMGVEVEIEYIEM